jgi:ketosteroid isomerase-like protein
MLMEAEHEELRALNAGYIRALLTSDTAWYEARLADDFVCIDHDGVVLDKQRFLRKISGGSNQATYEFDFVDIRVFGDVALIRAIGSWSTHSGTTGVSHYTDVWVRNGGDWKAVSAQITRPA